MVDPMNLYRNLIVHLTIPNKSSQGKFRCSGPRHQLNTNLVYNKQYKKSSLGKFRCSGPRHELLSQNKVIEKSLEMLKIAQGRRGWENMGSLCQ